MIVYFYFRLTNVQHKMLSVNFISYICIATKSGMIKRRNVYGRDFYWFEYIVQQIRAPFFHMSLFLFIPNWYVHQVPLYAPAGGRLNKKDGLTRYGDSHVKDKTS